MGEGVSEGWVGGEVVVGAVRRKVEGEAGGGGRGGEGCGWQRVREDR